MHSWKRVGLFVLLSANLCYGAQKYDVVFRGADLRDAVRMLAVIAEKNAVIPDSINQTVTARFKSIEPDEALEAILDANDLGVLRKGKTIRVATQKRLEELGGDLRIRTYRLMHADSEDLARQAKDLLSKRGSVAFDKRTNKVTVRDTDVNLRLIQGLIADLDVPERQILLEAKIVQIRKDTKRALGIQWGINKPTGNVQAKGIAVGDNNFNINAPTSDAAKAGITLNIGTLNDVRIDAQLTALEKRGDLKVLSRPSVVTMNNQKALMRSIFTFFVRTGDLSLGDSADVDLERIESGITLNVTPHISQNDFIKMILKVVQSEPDFSTKIDGIPSIIDNTAETTIFLKDQETTVIGGLLTRKVQDQNEGMPFLSNMPIVGALFGSLDRNQETEELMIFIRPTIVRNPILEMKEWPEAKISLRKPEKNPLTETKEEPKFFGQDF